MSDTITAAVLVIGNEILSGRTKDANIAYLGQELNHIGIRLTESRIVADDEQDIVDALNALRARYDYVFTTGGIGPTHDDITADSVAAAFGVGIDYHPEVYQVLREYFENNGLEANEARMRMARVPDGASLIDNDVSLAPGFQLDNVFVLAGVPRIARNMFERAKSRLRHGETMLSRSVRCHVGEGTVAEGLSALQAQYTDIDIGSYPWSENGKHGTSLVARSTDEQRLKQAADDIYALVEKLGGEPHWEND